MFGGMMDTGISGLLSFSGGGYTGGGSRTGGMDGEGGYLAVIHPKETIVDHTQPSSGAGGNTVVVNMNINTPDANSFRQSQRQIQQDMQRMAGGALNGLS
jgi:hypothetical protein